MKSPTLKECETARSVIAFFVSENPKLAIPSKLADVMDSYCQCLAADMVIDLERRAAQLRERYGLRLDDDDSYVDA